MPAVVASPATLPTPTPRRVRGDHRWSPFSRRARSAASRAAAVVLTVARSASIESAILCWSMTRESRRSTTFPMNRSIFASCPVWSARMVSVSPFARPRSNSDPLPSATVAPPLRVGQQLEPAAADDDGVAAGGFLAVESERARGGEGDDAFGHYPLGGAGKGLAGHRGERHVERRGDGAAEDENGLVDDK